ncbi:hypothetical protein ACRAWG_28100 [Methylobacterium sp. P31]
MTFYRICLLAADGSTYAESELDCEHDDVAIDYAGRLNHPHEIQVWEGERLVARFPSETAPRSPFDL